MRKPERKIMVNKDDVINAMNEMAGVNQQVEDSVELEYVPEGSEQKEEKEAKHIPYDRFKEVNEQKNKYREEAEKLKAAAEENELLKKKLEEYSKQQSVPQSKPIDRAEIVKKLSDKALTPEVFAEAVEAIAAQKAEHFINERMSKFNDALTPIVTKSRAVEDGIEFKELEAVFKEFPEFRNMGDRGYEAAKRIISSGKTVLKHNSMPEGEPSGKARGKVRFNKNDVRDAFLTMFKP